MIGDAQSGIPGTLPTVEELRQLRGLAELAKELPERMDSLARHRAEQHVREFSAAMVSKYTGLSMDEMSNVQIVPGGINALDRGGSRVDIDLPEPLVDIFRIANAPRSEPSNDMVQSLLDIMKIALPSARDGEEPHTIDGANGTTTQEGRPVSGVTGEACMGSGARRERVGGARMSGGMGAKALTRQVKRWGPTDMTVLLTGERGVGKGYWAEQFHLASPRAENPRFKKAEKGERCSEENGFFSLTCAHKQQGQFEAQLFGACEGAYTGAVKDRVGCVERAKGVTLFLDEIGELSVGDQALLLRFVENGEFQKLGSTETEKADVRLILATNSNLPQRGEDGTFREDLLDRLRIRECFHIAPLRERRDEIPRLAGSISRALKTGGPGRSKRLSMKTRQALAQIEYDWPGNVRQLKGAIEKAFGRPAIKGQVTADTVMRMAREWERRIEIDTS